MRRLILIVPLLLIVFSFPAQSQDDQPGEPDAEEKESPAERLGRLKAKLEPETTPLEDYQDCREYRDKEGFEDLLPKFAARLAEDAKDWESPRELGDTALMLHDDGFEDTAEPLVRLAVDRMIEADFATVTIRRRDENGNVFNTLKPDPTFAKLAKILGWEAYKRPRWMDEASLYDVEGAREYEVFYNFDVDQVYRDAELFAPELLQKLNELEATPKSALAALKAQHEEDGYALNARRAWIRFRYANDNRGKIDRRKSWRSYSPGAMEREDEDFDAIWTYSYARPFVCFQEIPIGQSEPSPGSQSVAERLAQLYEYFQAEFTDRFKLTRQKPQYNAKVAAEENWPFRVVILKDEPTFNQFMQDVQARTIPGARAFYSPINEAIITYALAEPADEDTRWFHESALLHEGFHLLSDHFAANPKFTIEELMAAPRYSSILVQEGLADCIAGFGREGESYEFMQLHHIRLKSFKNVHEQLGEKVLFRLRDLLKCRSFGQCAQVGVKRALELGQNPMAVAQAAMGLYYPAAWSAVYFFQHYEVEGEHPYREKWWDFLRKEYTGENTLESYADETAIATFKEIFEIEDDEDWDEIEKQWLEFILKLEPDESVTSPADDVELPGDDD